MKAKDVMTRDVRFIHSDASIEEAASMMMRHEVGALPAFREGLVVGIVSDGDIVRRGLGQGRDPRRTRIADVMSDRVPCCYEHQDVEEAANIMSNKGVRVLLVVDERRRPVGILTLQDLARGSRDGRLALTVLSSS